MIRARGPGRVNLIGEHTDYNGGLALPFAIDRGVTVEAEPLAGGEVVAEARDLGETDAFPVANPPRGDGWRAFVRGTVAELRAAGVPVPGARLAFSGDVPLGIRGSEVRLAEALHGYGTEDVATEYLNAGSGVLREAAEERARRSNYRILHMGGHANVTWGQF